jgi:prevent-host-death family protein
MRKNEKVSGRRWNLQDAKARLSELVDRCAVGEPQIILRRGRPAAVLISFPEYERRGAPKESLLSFFQRSPLYGIDLDLERSKEAIDELRDIDL